MQRRTTLRLAALAMALAAAPGFAQKNYGPGVSDTEIVLGQTQAYSGPLSAFGTLGKVEEAWFRKVNDEGGVNGRKIRLISLDDAYSPPKTLELTRKLVEQDNVLAIFSTMGTPTNTSIQRYLNGRKVPHLLISSGASKWNDPKNFPWSVGFNPNFHTEGKTYAQLIMKTKPDAKIALLYPNDDFGKDYTNGFKEGLGDKQKMIVSEQTYISTDPTVDSQLVTLKASGADVFFNVGTPKFAAQAIRKAGELGWKPMQFLNNASSSIGATLVPAGVEHAVGIVTVQYLKDATNKRWAEDPGIAEFKTFMQKYYPQGDLKDFVNTMGVAHAQTMVQILRQCGDDLSRENVMRQAANLKDLQLSVMIPGVKINTGPDDHAPIESVQMVRFDGTEWVPFGEIMGLR
jgi:ABC-type branched-subunit amino acid transport system substrate-binding protein